MMPVLKKHDGTVVATKVEFADTLFRQMKGLMFRRSIPKDYAMIFDVRRERYVDIHMMFVKFPLDVVYLNRDRRIIDIKPALKPWVGFALPKSPAQYVIELPAGSVERAALKIGETLSW